MSANRRLAQLWLDARTTDLWASADTIDTYTDDLNCYLNACFCHKGKAAETNICRMLTCRRPPRCSNWPPK
jgi:hypothetical protein